MGDDELGLEHLLQHQLVGARFDDPSTTLRSDTLAAAEVEPMLWPAGVCSGRLCRWARELAGRVAVGVTSGEGPASPPLDGAACSALESGYGEFCASAVTPRAVEASIAANLEEWTRLDYQSVLFASADAAREGRLCALEDGAGMDALAALAGTTVIHTSVLAEQLDIDLKRLLLSAAPGDVLGPVAIDGDHVIVMVIEKEPPTPMHSAVGNRARLSVVEHAVQRALDDWIRWPEPLLH